MLEELHKIFNKSEEQSKEARLLMAPHSRVESLRNEPSLPADARRSAVLVLLVPPEGKTAYRLFDCSLLLIRRNTYEGVHSGQIAFPGGKEDPSDQNLKETALREAQEEMGIHPSHVQIVGKLPPLYIPPSHFILYPVVGLLKKSQIFVADPREVADYRLIPLPTFLDPKHRRIENVRLKENLYTQAPCYCIDDYCIWGATAMVIADLVSESLTKEQKA